MLYIDTCVLLALLTPEVHSSAATSFLAEAQAPLAISSWSVTELHFTAEQVLPLICIGRPVELAHSSRLEVNQATGHVETGRELTCSGELDGATCFGVDGLLAAERIDMGNRYWPISETMSA